MKKILFSVIAILFIVNLQAQKLEFDLTVVDIHTKPVSGMTVMLKEIKTHETKTFTTDNSGKVTIKLDSGENWRVSVGEMYNCKTITVPKYGKVHYSEYISYN